MVLSIFDNWKQGIARANNYLNVDLPHYWSQTWHSKIKETNNIDFQPVIEQKISKRISRLLQWSLVIQTLTKPNEEDAEDPDELVAFEDADETEWDQTSERESAVSCEIL